MTGSRKNIAIPAIFIIVLILAVFGCSQPENRQMQESVPAGQEAGQSASEVTDQLQPAVKGTADAGADKISAGAKEKHSSDAAKEEQVMAKLGEEQYPGIFIQMLANHPLDRHGELSPDKRYYAYEERSSIILVQLPDSEEYETDKTLLPKVLYIDGIREGCAFAELEEDFARRLRKPLLSREELNEAHNKLRSVYDWRNYYNQKFSPNTQYLAYLGYDSFGSE